MRILFGAVLIAGLGLSGFAVFQVHRYISQLQAELSSARANANTVEMVNVFVAGRELRYGQQLVAGDVGVARFPAHAVPEGAISEVEDLFPEGIDHRIVLRAMDPREPILLSKLTDPGRVAGLTSHLTTGKRAFTIPVNQSGGIAGFLRPGDHVDIFWTGRTRDDGEITQLIQPRVRLIAVDQSADMDRSTNLANARTVTVEATPQQAAALAQAQSSGRLSLALVGIDDVSDSGSIEVTQDALLNREREVVTRAEVCHIRTRRGNELVLIEIPCTN